MARQRRPVDGAPHRPGGLRRQCLMVARLAEPFDPDGRMVQPRQHCLAAEVDSNFGRHIPLVNHRYEASRAKAVYVETDA